MSRRGRGMDEWWWRALERDEPVPDLTAEILGRVGGRRPFTSRPVQRLVRLLRLGCVMGCVGLVGAAAVAQRQWWQHRAGASVRPLTTVVLSTEQEAACAAQRVAEAVSTVAGPAQRWCEVVAVAGARGGGTSGGAVGWMRVTALRPGAEDQWRARPAGAGLEPVSGAGEATVVAVWETGQRATWPMRVLIDVEPVAVEWEGLRADQRGVAGPMRLRAVRVDEFDRLP